ncbi:Hsp70 family protein [Pseudonocardia halophobica]|uniref:Hsp70 family protein n=1 Tax=Pseudonocardia halophobica TaxID=29401 RepID=UPI003D938F3A
MSYSLGVDLGTTFVAAAVSTGSRVEMVTLGDRSVVTPAVVYLREDGTVVTGDAAGRRALSNPDRVGREFKRRLGDPTPLILGGAPHAVTALLAVLLTDVVARVSATQGAAPDSMVLTHPANWGPFRRELFDEVPQLAGVAMPRMVTEPEAAAAHYAASRRLENGEIVAVYDLGGGTFDATVLRKRSEGIEILGSPEGIERLGGVDFDEAILAHVNYAAGGALSELDMSDPQTTVALARLRQDCVLAKEALSIDTETTIPVFLPHRCFDVRLTRAEFEDMIRATIDSTVRALQRTLRSGGVGPDELSAVLLVGGSSRIPLVARMVSEELGRPTVVDAHPKYAVALGAALLAEGPGATVEPNGHAVPGALPGAPGTFPAVAGAPPNAETVLDDDVQFSVYRPRAVRPATWSPLLVFAHKTETFLDRTSGAERDPFEEVRTRVEKTLGRPPDPGDFRQAESNQALPRGAVLRIRPKIDHCLVNPPMATFRWQDPVHEVPFLVYPSVAAAGRRVRGRVEVWLGPLLIGEVLVSFEVRADAAEPSMEPEAPSRYRKIFASYSHRDVAVVEALVPALELLGDRVVYDRRDLRCAEHWPTRILELIREADVFQLYWSHNSMRSIEVRREWEYALSLGRQGFVRPFYWQAPIPRDDDNGLPPEMLTSLHWAQLPDVAMPAAVHAAAVAPPRSAAAARSAPVGRPAAAGSVMAAPSATAAAPSYTGGPDAPGGSDVAGGRPGGPPPPRPSRPSGAGGRSRKAMTAGLVAAVLLLGIGGVGSFAANEWGLLGGGSSTAAPSTTSPARENPLGPAPVAPSIATSVPIPALGATIPVGRTPGFIALSPNGRLAYIANRNAGVLTVMDTASDKVIAVVPVEAGPPQYLAFAPDGERVYVSIFNDQRTINLVGVLDTSTNAITSTIPVGVRPFALAVSPDGSKLYVPNHDSGTITVIDTATEAVVHDIRVAPNPHWVAFSPDGTRAYAACHESGVVSIINTADDTVVGEVKVQTSPHSVEVSPDGKLVANVNYDSDSVTVIDTATEQVIATVPVGRKPQDLAWAPDGRFLYVTNVEGDSLSVINAGTWAVTATLPTGDAPTSLAVTPDGKKAYVTNLNSGTLTEVHLTG